MFVKIPKFIQSLFPSIIWRNKSENKEIWLTFDDGPCPKATPLILEILAKEDIKATFFLIGKQIEKYPRLKDKIIEYGHTIGNHSYSHLNGWLVNKKKYISDVSKCQKLFSKNNLFRPPYGKITSSQIAALKENYKIILWDVLSLDFQKRITPFKVKENIIRNTKDGSIIVLHNNQKGYRSLKPILSEIIIELKQKGFKFSATW